ncbi:MAG: glycolate oxidase subunit GlcE [Pseudomonadaceae bacterium]|nr:glycolate oxidase subunit GlcE [Pseudomonadaceae bacterium]
MDISPRLVDAVQTAQSEHIQLRTAGTGSKRQWLPGSGGQLLVTTEHVGIVAYDPAELVITARCGTPVKEIVSVLAQHNQHLAFEPPQFFGSGTVGGMVASGLSGPARPWGGSTRDAVLGVKLCNGLGEVLNFGGRVMKNVAGYDVSRLAAGSWGALGVLLEASLRVQPMAQSTATLSFEMDAAAANEYCRNLARSYTPLNAVWWNNNQLFLRLSGSAQAVEQKISDLGGHRRLSDQIWRQISDHDHKFFKATYSGGPDRTGHKLWRVITPPGAPLPEHYDVQNFAMEWAGGQRWWWHNDSARVQAYASEVGGWAHVKGEPQTVDETPGKYMLAIKQAFDPHGLFLSPMERGITHAD